MVNKVTPQISLQNYDNSNCSYLKYLYDIKMWITGHVKPLILNQLKDQNSYFCQFPEKSDRYLVLYHE